MLKRVSIQNFKSLKDVTLDLQPVNLLIGPNNSGKTGFLKALEGNYFSNQNIEIHQTLTFKHQPLPITISFDFRADPDGYMSKKYNTGQYTYHISFKADFKRTDDLSYIQNAMDDWFTDSSEHRMDIPIRGGHTQEFNEYRLTRIFKPDPSKLIHQVIFSADQVLLTGDCSNLILFYFNLEANFRQNAKAIQHGLSNCIPEIAYFTVPPVKIDRESFLGLKFFDKDENGYWADEVSEGVLYFLALLCIINQPNPPKLLLLEEPERGIHPRRIREVMDFIFRLAEEKNVQIILTTHNEHVLDEFSTRPEAVFVFDKDEEGATYVRNLQTDIIEPTNQRNRELGLDDIDLTTNLSENWLFGLLGGVPPIV
jgi:predicted ATPase